MKARIATSDPDRAAAFASPIRSLLIQHLIGAELTLGELARLTGLPLSLAHYHLKKCMALGLAEVTRTQARSGRAIKHYRAVAQTFFVPAELIQRMPGTDLTRQLREALDHHQNRTVEGIEFTHDGAKPRTLLVRDRAHQMSSLELWLDLGLSKSKAAALVDDMKALVERYRLCDDPGEPRYLIHLAAVRTID